MSKVAKKFDCVEMKRAIHRRIAEKNKGLTPEQIRIKNEENLATSDSPLARWWRSLPDGNRHGKRNTKEVK